MKEKAVKFAKRIPNGKAYLEVITAALSIPVLLTVIILNFSNLNNNKKAASPTPSVNEKVIYVPGDEKNALTPTSAENCKKEIGPAKISSPTEGETVTDNPVYFIIDYTNRDYCSVVWSYRINGGSWSNYTANNPVVYNIPNGNIKFELKVQSTVVQEETTLTRNFTYRGTPTATSSATTN